MQKSKPLSPTEAVELHSGNIPDFVIDAFNELIIKELSVTGHGVSAIVRQDKVVELCRKKLKGEEVFSFDWLNIEPIFRSVGWKVDYVKSDYTDVTSSYFSFLKTT